MKKYFYLFLIIIPCFVILLSGCGKPKQSYYYLTLPESTDMYTLNVNSDTGDGIGFTDENNVRKANILTTQNNIIITVSVGEGWQFAENFTVKIGENQLNGMISSDETTFTSEKVTLTASATLTVIGIEVATKDIEISAQTFVQYNFDINGEELTSPIIRIPYMENVILNVAPKEEQLKPVPDYLFMRNSDNSDNSGQTLIALTDQYNRALYSDGSKDFKLSYMYSHPNAELSVTDDSMNTYEYRVYNVAPNKFFQIKKVNALGVDIGDLFGDTVQSMSTVYFKIFPYGDIEELDYEIIGLNTAQLKVNNNTITADVNGVFEVKNITTDLYFTVEGIFLQAKVGTPVTYIASVINKTGEDIRFFEDGVEFNPYAHTYNTQCVTANTKIRLLKGSTVNISSLNGMNFTKDETEDEQYDFYSITNITEGDTIIFTKKLNVTIEEDDVTETNFTIQYKTSIDGTFNEFDGGIEVNRGDILIIKITPTLENELGPGGYPQIIDKALKLFLSFDGYANSYFNLQELMPSVNTRTGNIITGEDGSVEYIIAQVLDNYELTFNYS